MSDGLLRIWNYGGGTQSIALLCLIRNGELPTPDYAIMADTKDETDEVYAWLEFVKPLMPCELRVVEREGKEPMEEVFDRIRDGRRLDKPPFYAKGKEFAKRGQGAPIGRDCTREWKIKVIEAEVKRLLGLSKNAHWPKELAVEQWLGISSDEAIRMKTSVNPWCRFWHPLIETEWPDDGTFWRPQMRHPGISRRDCVQIVHTTMLHENWNAPTPDPPRSACKRCPYRSNAGWRRMRDHEPHNFKEACESDKELRSGPNGLIHGMREPVYLHRSCQPLELVDLDTDMGSAMDDECAGICGV